MLVDEAAPAGERRSEVWAMVTRMRCLTVAIVVLSLAACGRSPEGAERLGPRFAAAASRLAASGPSDGLAAASRAAKDEDADAIALLVAARERGERLPGEPCLGGLLEWDTLATMAMGEPGMTDLKRLEATAWLAKQVREERPSLVGTVVGLSMTRDVLRRLKEAGLPLTAAIAETLPPADMVKRAFAREALCVEQQIAGGLEDPTGGESLAGQVVDNERRMVVAFLEEVMDGVEAAATPADMIRVLERAAEEAATSDSEVVRVVFNANGYGQTEEYRREIAELAAALPRSKAAPAP